MKSLIPDLLITAMTIIALALSAVALLIGTSMLPVLADARVCADEAAKTLTYTRAAQAEIRVEPVRGKAPRAAKPADDDAIPLDAGLQGALYEDCAEYGVPVSLALGLMETESRFDPEADNGLCYGLMQLNRDYFPDGLAPAENIRAGLEYLGSLLARYDTAEAALTAYNAGQDTGARGYANAVLDRAEAWEVVLAK